MKTTFDGVRDRRGEWRPETPLQPAPLLVWPPRPLAALKWLFGFPGFFLPWGVIYMAFPVVTWFWLTPPLEEMRDFRPGWLGFLLARNAVLVILVTAAWHARLYAARAQGTDFKYNAKWLARDNPVFLFRNQFLDNMFWTLASAVPIWTAYEALTLWAYANHLIPYVDWSEHPVYCALLMCAVPVIRDVHFYLIHRLIHWGPLYRWVHYLHHNNVNVGPSAGLAMHPVEHLLYFTGVLLHWVLPSHPIHALFHLQHAALTPQHGHVGFAKVALAEGVEVATADYFHYLHHKHFECNYGPGAVLPLDQWFGSYHDGTDRATEAMNARFLARVAQKQRAEG